MLSREERGRLFERAITYLYYGYIEVSQRDRSWLPNRVVDWSRIRTDHSPEMATILKGYFGVEQYVHDYVLELLKIIREDWTRSHFHIRWGSEEAKHSELWRNCLLYGKIMTAEQLDAYMHELNHEKQYTLPWNSALHMTIYTVFQELATRLNYSNTYKIVAGKSLSSDPELVLLNDVDPILATAAATIAKDEAAHYGFFRDVFRLFLYYFPTECLEALQDVIKYFAMPVQDLLPDRVGFEEVVARAGIYGPQEHGTDVLGVALRQLGFTNLKAFLRGLRASKDIPDEGGVMRRTAIYSDLDWHFFLSEAVKGNSVEGSVQDLYQGFVRNAEETQRQGVEPVFYIDLYASTGAA